MGSEEHPDLSRFRVLGEVIADSSSLIYMKKAGFLERFLGGLEVYTIGEVIEETGYAELAAHVLDHNFREENTRQEPTTDTILIRCAVKENLPVISEDRKILLAAERNNLPYFNALMMLNFLLFRRKITLAEHGLFFRRLLESARYSRRVLAYSLELFWEIRRRL